MVRGFSIHLNYSSTYSTVMKVKIDQTSTEITIDGFKFTGFRSTEKCPKCWHCQFYNDIYDVFFCAYCNTWLERKCGDSKCHFCTERPKKPLPEKFPSNN